MGEKNVGMVRYQDVGADYLDKRQLKKSAGWILLWALGVGAVISGEYSGWNLGLKYGGFGGLAVATVAMTAMYVCMVFTIAELSAALPHAGGFFSFTRNAFGPTGGFICGLTDTIEYVVSPAVIVYFIGGYMQTLCREAAALDALPAFFATIPPYVWWLLYYAVFVMFNIRGVELTLKVGLIVTLVAVAVLVVFFVKAVGEFDAKLLTNIEPAGEHASPWLPQGWFGVFAAVPFAIWFFLGIEQLPLAAEESHNVVKDMPKALIFGIATMVVLAFLTLILNTGVGEGAKALGGSNAPLADGFKAVFPSRTTTTLLTLVSLAGMIASFHTLIYGYGRVLFALSRAGYIPLWMSLTSRRHTPYAALTVGAIVGLGCAALIEFTKQEGKESVVGAALLNMAVFGAVISYAMVMFSYIKLRISRPDLHRPYRSPLGVPGALLGGLLAVVAVVATLAVEDYRPAVLGTALFLVAGVLYFLLYSRHRLVAKAPEEESVLLARAAKELAHE